jgi:hypothetical protein
MRIPTPRFELAENPLRIRLVVRRTDMVRLRGEQLHPVAQIGGLDGRAEFGFERGLIAIGRAKARGRGQAKTTGGDRTQQQ